MDASFFQAPVAVPKLSGFDKSFMNLYTAKCGTLVPALCDELIPGSIVDLKMAASVSLPPLASDTFMRCSLKVEAFFVPLRLCYGGFEHWFVQDEFDTIDDVGASSSERNQFLPCFTFGLYADDDSSLTWNMSEVFGAGTLSDYLGFKAGKMDAVQIQSGADGANRRFSFMPYIAYHKCWSDWYRSSLIQKDCFAPISSSAISDGVSVFTIASIPFSTLPSPVWASIASIDGNFANRALTFKDSFDASSGYLLADGVNIFQLRQRNFGFDFFTCATPSPQNGAAASVTLDPTSLTTLGKGFTISQLRSMNSLQQWRERNNLTGDRYVDRLYGQYGCRPSDGIAQRVLCIGSADIEVYNKGVYTNTTGGSSPFAQSPFTGQLGNRGGSAYGTSQGAIELCHGFKATEPGYLLVITSLVPRVTYASGLDMKLARYCYDGSIGELPNPILQNIGPEPIYTSALTDNVWEFTNVFGYTDRFGFFKAKFDELHGLVRDGESLESFALQRYLDESQDPRIDSEFLEIPTNYMDNVTAVAGEISEYGCWVDSYFDYKVSMPLSKYSLPSLQDPAYEHGKTIVVRRGGFRF